ncbi:MAG: SDR family oxidoreductase [bacterium]|nr:SDR family oxidoreductase [bacterium]
MKGEKTVVVTGASKGIGFAIVKNLLQSGFKIHMIANREDGLIRAQNELQKDKSVNYSVVDLTNRKEVKDFCNRWSNNIYGLVNNAGIWAQERLDEYDTNIWDPIMKLNVEGLYFLTKGLHSKIINGGRIINISSQLGITGRIGMGIYSASKHAVIGLTRCWALELGDRAITVNAVCPGWVNTESNRIEITQLAQNEKVSYKRKIKKITDPLTLHRFIEPEEVAQLVCFLIDSGGSGITGQIYEIK